MRIRNVLRLRHGTYLALVLVLGAPALAYWSWGGRNDKERPTLEAVAAKLKVTASDAARGERAKVVFRLKNLGRAAIEIESVSSTCTCLVPSEIEGRRVKAGAELPLEISVAIPEAGNQTQRLLVFHDGAASPLELQVEIEGRRKLPILGKVVNGRPFFANLSQDTAAQGIVVETFEEIGSEPWLGDLIAEHPSIEILRTAIAEESDESAGFIRRTYEYTVGWGDLPAQAEVRVPIHAVTKIDPKPGVFIGVVAALVKPARIRPTIARLEQGKIEEEWIVFANTQDAAPPWRIAEEFTTPEWLRAEWQESDGERRLKLTLTGRLEGDEPVRCRIPLVREDKDTEELEVIAYPRG